MLPLLQIAGDGEIHEMGEAVEELAIHFNLSEEEIARLLTSDRMAKSCFHTSCRKERLTSSAFRRGFRWRADC